MSFFILLGFLLTCTTFISYLYIEELYLIYTLNPGIRQVCFKLHGQARFRCFATYRASFYDLKHKEFVRPHYMETLTRNKTGIFTTRNNPKFDNIFEVPHRLDDQNHLKQHVRIVDNESIEITKIKFNEKELRALGQENRVENFKKDIEFLNYKPLKSGGVGTEFKYHITNNNIKNEHSETLKTTDFQTVQITESNKLGSDDNNGK